MRDAIWHRSQHPPRSRHASVADDDHLGALLVRDPHQRFCRLLRPHVRLAHNPDLCESLLCSIDVVLSSGSFLVIYLALRRGLPWDRRSHSHTATRAPAVTTHDVHFHAERTRELTRTVDRALGSF
jgi:hypothetical protein